MDELKSKEEESTATFLTVDEEDVTESAIGVENANVKEAISKKNKAPCVCCFLTVVVLLAIIIAPLALAIATGAYSCSWNSDETRSSNALDLSCQQDNDCAIKDVGNCCGYYPQCVNVQFEPDPSKSCPEGGDGICGFPSIDHCVCNQDSLCEGIEEMN